MRVQRTLVDLEHEFWRGDAALYETRLTEDALMSLPEPVGVLTRNETVRSIADSPRWADVHLDDVRLIILTPDAAVLSYRATAQREGDEAPYVTRASSVYVEQDGVWRMAFHQQAPIGPH
jgi:hypothetical protein